MKIVIKVLNVIQDASPAVLRLPSPSSIPPVAWGRHGRRPSPHLSRMRIAGDSGGSRPATEDAVEGFGEHGQELFPKGPREAAHEARL
ncbi:hypothetical protein DFR58_104126 [Anaerobacterium chartisolvens]|uniref:Uncharacterized protein n=1 Tax=Anaerobacterium chartisolvens TaxID=1297424 RepID=A0A369BEE8_9FIRM|nr:hypothetical protein DFR58_104126 [Anaerobacterium chartisolvens]